MAVVVRRLLKEYMGPTAFGCRSGYLPDGVGAVNLAGRSSPGNERGRGPCRPLLSADLGAPNRVQP